MFPHTKGVEGNCLVVALLAVSWGDRFPVLALHAWHAVGQSDGPVVRRRFNQGWQL